MGSSHSSPLQMEDKKPFTPNSSRSRVSDERPSPHWRASDERPSPHWRASSDSQWIKKRDNGELHISAKALNITWGGDSRFWRWIEFDQEVNDFKVGAELLQVNWLEVTGKVDASKLWTNKRYEILYVVKFNVDAFGWHSVPVTFKLTTPNGKQTKKSEILETYRNKIDTWQEIRVGEFQVPPSGTGFVEFAMFEVDSKWWKGSMIVGGVVIRPVLLSP